MFEKQIKDIFRFCAERFYGLPQDEQEAKNLVKDIVSAERTVRQYTFQLPEPFNELLDLATNLEQLYAKWMTLGLTVGEEHRRMATTLCKDMKICVSNFDYFMFKQTMDRLKAEQKRYFLFRKPIKAVLDEVFSDPSYSHPEYREWTRDTAERVSKFYIVFRDLIYLNKELNFSLEVSLFYAINQYRFDRYSILYEAGLLNSRSGGC